MRRRVSFPPSPFPNPVFALVVLTAFLAAPSSPRNIVVKYVLTPDGGRIPSGERVAYTTSAAAPTTYNPTADPETRPVLIQAPLRVTTCKPKQKMARGRCRDIW